jgi:PKD repeat protein
VQNGNTVSFTANNLAGTSGMAYNWNFGDGNTATGSPVTHTYAQGNYYVTLTASSSSANCSKTANTTVFATVPPPNIISGLIIGDSTSIDTFKVWLITFDSVTNNLYAVDSQVVSNTSLSYPQYSFSNHPGGPYRVKAHQLDGPASGTGFLPTYHLNSLYWNTASIIHHILGVSTTGKNIIMQTGTVTSGPGFIGGNVTLGANKGTSNGIPGQLMFLRDNTEKVIAMTFTDNNGDYLFSDLPLGSYSIYPEETGYAITPASITLTNIIKGSHNVHFEKHEAMQVIVPKATSVASITGGHSFNIYPNPGNGVLHIDLPAGTNQAVIAIRDIAGKNVYSQELTVDGGKAQVNASHLRAGQYLITVEANGQSTTQKFVLDK